MIDITIQGRIPSLEGFTFKNSFDKVSKYMEISIKRNFAEGGRPNAWQARKDGSPSHLNRGGALFSSIGSAYGDNFAEAGVMTPLPYAMIQQEGGEINHPGSDKFQVFTIGGQTVFTHGTKPHKINIPARPYVIFQEEDFTWIINEMGNDLVTFLNTHGEKIG